MLHTVLKKALLEGQLTQDGQADGARRLQFRHKEDPGQGSASFDDKISFLVGYERKKCAALLFMGSIFGLLGFVFAFIIGLLKFLNPHISEFHERFASGNGYFPATVSEMVHDPQEPAGKCFFAFEFIGAIFIFLSWYPWELRSVYIGDSHHVPGCKNLSWSMFRQFCPPCGMMLVATVTTTPFAQATQLDYFCIAIHLTGAVMLFAGYAAVESHCLGFLHVKQHETMQKTLKPREVSLRYLCLVGIVICYVVFCTITAVVVLPLEQWGGKNDVWEKRTITNERGLTFKKMVLVDTASGFVLWLKILSYVSEVACGLFLISSFLVIWYFCEERTTDLNDELFSVVDLPVDQTHDH
mmetsp:Transcript_167247/g.537231  ORF Transcript_167247/g.537231 Transcript_167247/m.537231 type:complete len:355 (-) Transcript_167247:72-1136(-)